jgi:hypothetical protein
MILVNEKVEHISYGIGVVTEEEGNKILVQFKEDIGSKTFLYPDAFERFLKVVNPNVESSVLEELHAKLQQKQELERLERERESTEREERRVKPTSTRKRAPRTVKQKA